MAFFLDFFEIAFIVIPLLAPVATQLGIDLVWFGVLLGANMQTSFMHPPFGFALFYLRGIAAKETYVDRITGATIAPISTRDIYVGAIPYVGLQLALTACIIAFPQAVLYFLDIGPTIDPNSIKSLDLPAIEAPPPLDLGPGGGLPGLEPPASLPGLEPPPQPGTRAARQLTAAARPGRGGAVRADFRPSSGCGSRSCRSCTRRPATTGSRRRGRASANRRAS